MPPTPAADAQTAAQKAQVDELALVGEYLL